MAEKKKTNNVINVDDSRGNVILNLRGKPLKTDEDWNIHDGLVFLWVCLVATVIGLGIWLFTRAESRPEVIYQDVPGTGINYVYVETKPLWQTGENKAAYANFCGEEDYVMTGHKAEDSDYAMGDDHIDEDGMIRTRVDNDCFNQTVFAVYEEDTPSGEYLSGERRLFVEHGVFQLDNIRLNRDNGDREYYFAERDMWLNESQLFGSVEEMEKDYLKTQLAAQQASYEDYKLLEALLAKY